MAEHTLSGLLVRCGGMLSILHGALVEGGGKEGMILPARSPESLREMAASGGLPSRRWETCGPCPTGILLAERASQCLSLAGGIRQVASLLQNSQQALEPKGWLSDSVS